MMKNRFVSLLALSSVLAGCAPFGPERSPPAFPAPDHYSAQDTGSAAEPVAAGRLEAAWWRAYRSEALNALVAEGLANSPSLATAQAALEAARQQLKGQVGSTLLPKVDAGFSAARQNGLSLPSMPKQTVRYDVFQGGVGASYSFDFFGAAYMVDRALAGQVQQQAWQFDATRRALAANIVKAVIAAASLKEQVTAAERMADLAEQQFRQMQSRHQAGGASQDDALAAEQQAAAAASSVPPLRAQLLAVRHAEAVLLGRTPDRAPEPLALDVLHLPEQLPVTVPSELLHHRPDILVAEAAVQVSADKVGAAIAAKYPSLSLSAAYGHGGFDWSSFTSPAGAIWNVAGGLTQPLFHGGALEANQRGAEASYQGALSNYRQTVLSAFESVADILAALEQDAGLLAQAQRADKAAEAQNSNLSQRNALGAVPYSVALAAGQNYQAAHLTYLRACAARLTDSAALFDAMGDPDASAQSADDDVVADLLP